ncbi:hypothetical protein ACNS7O_17955 (plasmid) [Haloferacaceae archaeon DSL9]
MKPSTSSRAAKGALAVGFLTFTIAVVVAYSAPATGYELSLFNSTPIGYWIAIGASTAIALVVLATATGRRVRQGASLLAAASILSYAALPLLRSYYFYGAGDSMTHLGWAREIATGRIAMTDILYPGIHYLAVTLSETGGIPLTRALPIITLAMFTTIYVVFTALCVRRLSNRTFGWVVGLFAALLFIPANGISVQINPHPSSQVIMFLPVLLYLILRYVTLGRELTPLQATLTPTGIALVLTGSALVLIHPQETMSLTAVLVAIAGIQFLFRRFKKNHAFASHPPLYIPAAVIGTFFFAWAVQHDRVRERFTYVTQTLFGEDVVLEETSQRSVSIATLGGSIEELFVKLFLVTLIVMILAAAILLMILAGRVRDRPQGRNAALLYLAIGAVPVGVAFLIVFFSAQGDHYFRFMGFIMSIVTVIGAVALAEGLGGLRNRTSRSTAIAVFVVLLVVLMPLQMLTLYPSPYMYQSNQHVTETQTAGYEFAFDHFDDEDAYFVGVRGSQRRSIDALYGSQATRTEQLDFPGYRTTVDEQAFRNGTLRQAYDGDRYMVTTRAQYEREVGLYDGLRYNREGFNSLESTPGINRVHSNDEAQMYLITPNE